MTMALESRQHARTLERKAEEREFRLALRIAFVFFLAVSLALRLVPRRWRPAPFAVTGGRSFISEARAAAHTIVPLAFMR